MPAEFQKTIDYTLVGLQNTSCFLGDFISVSTGSESDHLSYISKCLKKLGGDNRKTFSLKMPFRKKNRNWIAWVQIYPNWYISTRKQNASCFRNTTTNNIKTPKIFLGASTLYKTL